MRAAVYVRISRDPGGTQEGVDRQEEDCRDLVRDRGWEVAGLYSDNDVSAYNGKARPAWRLLLKAIEAGEVEVVIAWANDRLYRRVEDQLDLMRRLQERGGKIVTVKDGEMDPNSDSGRMTMGILANVAAFESDRKSGRLVAKHAELAKRGLWMGGRRPFGYRVVEVAGGKSLEIVPKEAAAVRDAVGRILDGESMRSVARRWNASGLRTTWGNPWELKPFKQLLTSPAVVGDREHRGEVVGRAAWPPILDRRTWNRLRAEVASRSEGVPLPTSRRYLLTGLLRCGTCGDPLLGHGGGTKAGRSYGCLSDKPHPKGTRVKILAEPLERLVLDRAAERAANVTTVRDPGKVARGLQKELNDIENRLMAWAREAGEAGMSAAEIRAGREPLVQRREEIEEEISRATTIVTFVKDGKHFADIEATAKLRALRGPKDPRAELETKVDHVTVFATNRNRWVRPEERVKFAWR